MDGDCPRLNNNNNAVLARRRRDDNNWHYWAGSVVRRLVPRFVPKRKPRRLSGGGGGFFQAQLRRMKSRKQNKGKLSSSNNQIIANSSSNCKTTSLVNYQFTTATTATTTSPSHGNIHLNRLPKELLAEILVRLPVKYILRCRSVQKSWNYFIKSPVFIALQLNYQKQIITSPNHNHHHHPKYLLFKYRYGFGLTLRFDHIRCKQYCRLEFLPGYPGHAWFALSYGLICTSPLLDQPYNRNIYLWNPLINKYKTLPTSPLPSPQEEDSQQAWEALAFGFLPQVNDYVVIHIIKPCLPPHPHSVIIAVYSLNTNSWKKSSQNNVFIYRMTNNPDNVVFINGAAFWVGFNSNKQIILMCFDTKTNILSEISMPDSAASPPLVPVIHAIGQSIAYFVWEEGVIHFDMWVLKYDYINEFTWEKKMCVTPTPSEDVREEVVGVRNNGEPVLAKSKHLISYNLDSHQAKGFVKPWDRWNPDFPYNSPYEDHGSPYVIRPFVESLVMLNDD